MASPAEKEAADAISRFLQSRMLKPPHPAMTPPPASTPNPSLALKSVPEISPVSLVLETPQKIAPVDRFVATPAVTPAAYSENGHKGAERRNQRFKHLQSLVKMTITRSDHYQKNILSKSPNTREFIANLTS